MASPTPTATTPTKSKLTLPAILAYERIDQISGGVLLTILVVSPWAFGSTQPAVIWTLNVAGFALGLLLAAKLWIRKCLGHSPTRWTPVTHNGLRSGGAFPVVLMLITALLLIYVAISALNARADYDPTKLTLNYREYIRWLPHSYDRAGTWRIFFDYLAWACMFWGLRDWLLGMSPEEGRLNRAEACVPVRASVPSRLKLLLWVVSVSGALLALEGIIQRLAGSDKLLFLVQPRVNPFALSQFGPFAYRSNAAQYLNLIWPVTIGFWWWLQRAATRSAGFVPRHLLLLCAIVMAAAPIISTSRAGAVADLVMLILVAILFVTNKRSDGLVKLAALGVIGGALAAGAYFGWTSLGARLAEFPDGFRNRELMYETARMISRENPVFGTGPGTFEHAFQIYRQSTDEYWPAQLHDDWLELLLTFGWVGFALILVALALVVTHPFSTRGIPASRRFIWLIWLALAGCLLQARWDFPFRVYSVVLLFLALCSVLTVLAKAERSK